MKLSRTLHGGGTVSCPKPANTQAPASPDGVRTRAWVYQAKRPPVEPFGARSGRSSRGGLSAGCCSKKACSRGRIIAFIYETAREQPCTRASKGYTRTPPYDFSWKQPLAIAGFPLSTYFLERLSA